jgi:hypothetical protein
MADLELKVTIPYTFNVKAAPVQPVTVTPGAPEVILVPVPGGKGDKGDTGASGDGAQVFGETPTGAMDGTNLVFTVANPFKPGTTAVYLNGLREFSGDAYTETTSTSITFSDPPFSGDTIRIDYIVQ